MGKNLNPVDAQNEFPVMLSPNWPDYELLDSGNGEKLERFGNYYLIRPETGAEWEPALSRAVWLRKADATYHLSTGSLPGRWEFHRSIPLQWEIQYKYLRFQIQLSLSRHIGVFPEQAGYWDWIYQRVQQAGYPINVLNLFGYTGIATLAAASAGAQVVHVDASSRAIRWARLNQQLSNLSDATVRWLVDDALQFVEKEIRRGRQYEGLILDPPKFGHGPDNKTWEFDKLFPYLMEKCVELLGPNPRFIALTAYSSGITPAVPNKLFGEIMKRWEGKTSCGYIALQVKKREKLLSKAVYGRWEANSK